MHPDRRAVMPLMPEPIVQPEGTDTNAGERQAAKRVVATWRQAHPHLQCLVTADRLSAHAPPMETLHAHGLPSILGVKAGAQASLLQPGQAAEDAGRGTSYERHDRAAGGSQRFRFVHDRPLQASPPHVRGHCSEYGEIGPHKVQPCSGVTDLRGSNRNVYHLMRGGRARWKSANETCKTLQTQGDHFEPHDGHGEQHLAVVLARRMLLAFLVAQAQQLCGALLQAVWAKLGSKRLRWERRRALFYTYALASMRQLFEALFYGLKKPTPVFGFDSA